MISRRHLLLAAAAAAGCGRRKATAYRGYCLVANRIGRNIAVVDLTKFRVRQTIPLDAAPAAVVSHPAKPLAYVLAPDTGTIYEIDAATMAVSRRARAGNTAIGMQVGPRNDALWVLYRDPALLVELPFHSFKPRRRIWLPAAPDDFDLSTDSNGDMRAAIALSRTRTIAIVSLERAAIERMVEAGAAAPFVRFRGDGKLLLAANGPDRSVTFFDVATGKAVVRLPLPFEPRHYAVTADHGQIFLSGEGMDGVTIVFPYSTEVWQTILAGRAPAAMAAVPSTPPTFLLVANPATDNVTILDLATQNLSAIVNVGKEPGEIIITPDNRWALVLNQASGDMAVIRLDRRSRPSAEHVMRYKSAPLFTMIPVGEGPVAGAVIGW
jgi:DNA-binding beta-propeller fold protein YncE